MKFGFLSGIGEITPSIFSGLDAVNKARIFINLYNCCAGRELKIPLSYAYSGLNLEGIFLKRIEDLCEFKNPSRSKIATFCIASNAVICAYKSGKFDAVLPLAVSPKHPVSNPNGVNLHFVSSLSWCESSVKVSNPNGVNLHCPLKRLLGRLYSFKPQRGKFTRSISILDDPVILRFQTPTG